MSKEVNKEYQLAKSFLQFKQAYTELVAAAKALPDIDLSELYPFYLLDFEEIETNVLAWCSLHASNLLRRLPDVVDNPACLRCRFFRKGLNAAGQCQGAHTMLCGIFPLIVFTREAVSPSLWALGHKLEDLDDTSVQLLYMQVCDRRETNEEIQP